MRQALFPEWESVLNLQGSAIGQTEECEAVRLGDYACPRLSHKRLHCGAARRSGHKIGGIIKKIDGECTFAHKLTVIYRVTIASNKDKIGVRFADRDFRRRLDTSYQDKCRGQCSQPKNDLLESVGHSYSHSASALRHFFSSPSQTLATTQGVGPIPSHWDPCTSATSTLLEPMVAISHP